MAEHTCVNTATTFDGRVLPPCEACRVAGDMFHKHLDQCAQCRAQPFNLCAVGLPLLHAAGAAMVLQFKIEPGPLNSELLAALERSGMRRLKCEACGCDLLTRGSSNKCPPCRGPGGS